MIDHSQTLNDCECNHPKDAHQNTLGSKHYFGCSRGCDCQYYHPKEVTFGEIL